MITRRLPFSVVQNKWQVTAMNTAEALKKKLQEWKERKDVSVSDDDLPEVKDCAPSVKRLKAQNVDLLAVFQDYTQNQSKVVLNNAGESYVAVNHISSIRENLHLTKKQLACQILQLPPGIIWIGRTEDSTLLYINLLPVNIRDSNAICTLNEDLLILESLRMDWNRPSICEQFNMIWQVVKNKIILLDNMFLAMCFHSNPATIEALYKRLSSILLHDYAADLDNQLSNWCFTCDIIRFVLVGFGVQSSYQELTGDSSSHDYQRQSNISPHINNIKALLNLISCITNKRSSFACSEIADLIEIVVKLGMDKSLICSNLTPHFQEAIQSLLLLPSDDDFAVIESTLCMKLVSLVKHHHNRLYIVQLIPATNRRMDNLRETLAFVLIKQTLSACEYSELNTEWQLQMLCNEFEKLELSTQSDYYQLFSLIQLFDIAVGLEITKLEKDILDCMNVKLSKDCSRIMQNPLAPDLTTLKGIMYTTSWRWTWLVKQATDINEIFDIKGVETPSKISIVKAVELGPDITESRSIFTDAPDLLEGISVLKDAEEVSETHVLLSTDETNHQAQPETTSLEDCISNEMDIDSIEEKSEDIHDEAFNHNDSSCVDAHSNHSKNSNVTIEEEIKIKQELIDQMDDNFSGNMISFTQGNSLGLLQARYITGDDMSVSGSDDDLPDL